MDRIHFLKELDARAGRWLTKIFPNRRQQIPVQPTRVLFIRPGGIGDAALLIPTITALAERFPEARIQVLAEQRNAAVFHLCTHVDRIWRYDRPAELLACLMGPYDLIIDSEQWHRLSTVAGRISRCSCLIGFDTNAERRRLLDIAIPYRHDDCELDSFLHLLAPLGIAAGAPSRPFLRVPEAAARKTAELLGELIAKHQPYAVLFPGASIAERRWGAANFHEVARRLTENGLGLVVVGGREDQGEGEGIIAGLGGKNLAGRTSLTESAAIIHRAAVLVSGDSGLLHIGVGLGTPTVSLFGPGIAAKWAPRGTNHIVLNRKFPCSPCTRFGTTPPCPHTARCISSLTAAEVAAAALSLTSSRLKQGL